MKIILLIVSTIWQLPQRIVGLVLLAYHALNGGVSPRKRKLTIRGKEVTVYYWTADRILGGISLDILGEWKEPQPTLSEMLFAGYIIILKPSMAIDYYIRHEYGHTRQSRRLGPVYLLIIGVPSIIWAGIYKRMCETAKLGDRLPDYYDAPWEADANVLGAEE